METGINESWAADPFACNHRHSSVSWGNDEPTVSFYAVFSMGEKAGHTEKHTEKQANLPHASNVEKKSMKTYNYSLPLDFIATRYPTVILRII